MPADVRYIGGKIGKAKWSSPWRARIGNRYYNRRLLVIAAFLFVDWRQLLEHKMLRFRFKILK